MMMMLRPETHPAVLHFNEIKRTATAALKVARLMDVDFSLEQEEHMRAYLLKCVSQIRSVCDVLEARMK